MRTILLNCKTCGHKTKHNKDSISPVVGILLTIVTGGIFLPIWLLLFVLGGVFSRWHCERCGSRK